MFSGWIFFLMAFLFLSYLSGKRSLKNQEEQAKQKAEKIKDLRVRAGLFLDMHKEELARRKRQLVQVGSYGIEDSSRWVIEREYFLCNVLRKDADFEAIYSQLDASELRDELYQWIDMAADQSGLKALTEEVDELSPLDFEHYCAEVMRDFGWETTVTQASGDQGVDVIAVKNGVRVVLQCKKYSSPVGNKAVQEIAAGKIHEQAHHAAVVTNASFTPSARQLANTTGVKLLHVSELSEYANNIGREILPGSMG